MLYLIEGNESEFLYSKPPDKIMEISLTSNKNDIITAASVYAPMNKKIFIIKEEKEKSLDAPKVQDLKSIKKLNVPVYLLFANGEIPPKWRQACQNHPGINIFKTNQNAVKDILDLGFLEHDAKEYINKLCYRNPVMAKAEASRLALLRHKLYKKRQISLIDLMRIRGELESKVDISSFLFSLGTKQALIYAQEMSNSDLFALMGTAKNKPVSFFIKLLENKSPLLANILLVLIKERIHGQNALNIKDIFMFYAGWLVENNFIQKKGTNNWTVNIPAEKLENFYKELGVL